MKKLLLCLTACMFAASGLQAAPKLPRFSASTDDAVWYFIPFSTTGNYLSDRGNNIALRAVTLSSTSDASAGFKWALVGTKDSFRLVSGNGRSVVYSDAKGYFVCSKDSAATLCLAVSEDDEDCWEIRVAGSDMALTKASASASASINREPSGSALAALWFTSVEMLPPVMNAEGDEPVWYQIQFRAGAQTTIADQGAGKNVKQAAAARADEQLWRLIGDESGFKIKNKKNGTYLYVSGTSVMSTSSASQAGTFTLAKSENASYTSDYMIQSGSAGYFNAWQGITVGNNVGIWSSTTDQNNVVVFTAEADIELPEYATTGMSAYTPEHQSTLWYNVPVELASGLSGDKWKDYALPLGNGQLGSTFVGGVYKEDLQFNEKTLWTGTSNDRATYGSYVGGSGYGGYQNFGDVIVKQMDTAAFDFADGKGVKNYLRQLDLTTATGLVTFTSEATGVNYERRYVVSNPDNVCAYLFTADRPGMQSLQITLTSGKPGVDAATTYADGEATFNGKLQTVSYNARVKVVNRGGTLKTRGSNILVTGADSVLIYIAAGTDYDPLSSSYTNASLRTALAATVQERVRAAAARDWNALYADHVADHKQYFDRVEFVLDAAQNTQTTETLVNNYSSKKGTTDAGALMLEKLYFDYGRYLTIAGSRGIALPTNLQGIWNNSSSAPWGADIHANINVQMNYWPAEPTNLSELHLPLLDYIINMSKSAQWKQYATSMAGQTVGWTCITENNIFGGRGSFQTNYVIANAWYVTHLWQHYRYTLNRDFLKRAFPAMWGATQFWMERLVMANDGTYECPNEYSPEHGPGSENAVAHAQQLVAELFANTLEAIDVLGDDAGINDVEITTLRDRYDKLDKGLAIEQYTGQWGTTVNGISSGTNILREWKYSDYTAGANGHRHSSHLMCLYPFSQVEEGSDLFKAAVNSLQLRGDASTGWSMAWKVNLWARAKNGAHAHQIFDYALIAGRGSGGVFYNLFDVHAPYYFQIDGNFGACAGMAEMLMQSHTGTIEILPALPTSLWRNGHINGLKAVGDFTVDIAWKNAKADRVVIRNNQGQPLKVKCTGIGKSTVKFLISGKEVAPTVIDDNNVTITSVAGDEVYIFFNGVPTAINDVQAEARPLALSFNGRRVSVGGDVTELTLTDLQGRYIRKAKGSAIEAPRAAGDFFILTVTCADGSSVSRKIGF